IARAAEMDQGDVWRLERREDVKLSTLGRYARALGGRLQVAVVVGGHQYLLDVGEATHGAGAPARAGSSTKTTGAVALTGGERSRRPSSRGRAHRKRGMRSAWRVGRACPSLATPPGRTAAGYASGRPRGRCSPGLLVAAGPVVAKYSFPAQFRVGCGGSKRRCRPHERRDEGAGRGPARKAQAGLGWPPAMAGG